MNDEFRQMVIDALRRGEDLPAEWARELFPPEKREYELVYHGKEREEDILADTLAVPLQPVRTFGKNGDPSTGSGQAAWHNMLVFGDNLQAMKTLLKMKEDGQLVNADGTPGVRLIYIDPPFATKQDFRGSQDQKAYQDKIAGAQFIEFLRRRLVCLRELLSRDGSLYVHLDWRKAHYVKLILDEVMGEGNFKNEIVWRRTFAGKTISRNIPQNADLIFWYVAGDEYLFNPVTTELTEKDIQQFGKDDRDGRGPYATVALQKVSGPTPGTAYDYVDNHGRVWKHPPKGWRMTKDKLKRLENDNRLYITDTTIREKYYLRERMEKGKQVDNIWTDIGNLNRNPSEVVNYPTQKTEALLERIIKASSNPGDIVLDCFAGSGTTCAVAEKLGRRWIGVDCGKLAIYTIQKRMLNLKSEIGNKGKPLKPKPFMLYNAGLYDFSSLKQLPWDDWRFFALQLFGCRDEPHSIGGLLLDGKLKGASVLVFNHVAQPGQRIDEDTMRDIHAAVGKRIGLKFFIIAPRNVFAFQQDYLDFEDVRYYALRIPYSIINELHHREFTAMRQPSDETAVNDTVDAVGFDFIQPPKVEWTVSVKKRKGQLLNEACLKIKSFESRARLRGKDSRGGMETFSMLLLDFDYTGEVFDLDAVFYAHDMEADDWQAWFPIEALGERVMAVFLDIYGNESQEIIPRGKLASRPAKKPAAKAVKKARR